jgi:hypothetical protein
VPPLLLRRLAVQAVSSGVRKTIKAKTQVLPMLAGMATTIIPATTMLAQSDPNNTTGVVHHTTVNTTVNLIIQLLIMQHTILVILRASTASNRQQHTWRITAGKEAINPKSTRMVTPSSMTNPPA